MRIRLARPGDAPALAELFHAAVHAIGARDYGPEQCAAWSPAPADPEAYRTRMADRRLTFVAADAEDAPLGFIELETDGHIDRFYCHQDIAGTGVGTALYKALEAQAKARNIPFLHVEASEAARRFFLRQGFTLDHRRDFTLRGTPIHNYRMTKTLSR